MVDQDIPWEHWRSLLAVLETGSLSAAARRLGLTQPTLGRHIDALEAALGTRLFLRSREGLTPTATALALRTEAEAMAAAAAALRRRARDSGTELRGSLRLTTSEIIGLFVIPPLLAGFRRRHPLVAVELQISDESQNLLTKEADLAVRMYRPRQQQLVARLLGQVKIGLYAHEDYLKDSAAPTDWQGLSGHALIGFDSAQPGAGLLPEDPAFAREAFAFLSSSGAAQMLAVEAGCGIGACQVPLAGQRPRLRRLLPDLAEAQLPLWIARHEDAASPALLALMAELGAGLTAWLRGA